MSTQLATANQQVAGVFGAVDRLDSAPAPPRTAPAPFQDWHPQVAAYSGEPGRAREALLAQFYLHAWRIPSPPSGAPAAPIDWQAHQCGPNTPTCVPATRHRPSGPRWRGWGCARLRPGVRRLQSPPHAVSRLGTTDPTRLSGSWPSGSTSATSRRASTGAGIPRPAECRFGRLPALFPDEELNSSLSELTADTRCCANTLRQLEESDSAAGRRRGRPHRRSCVARADLRGTGDFPGSAGGLQIQASSPGLLRARPASPWSSW